MKKLLLLPLCLLVFLVIPDSPSVASRASKSGPTAKPAPSPFPNLTTLRSFKNPSGTTCRNIGAGKAGTEKAESNKLKNRFRLPSTNFQPIDFDQILALNQGRANSAGTKIIDFPLSNAADNQRLVSLEGFVSQVFVAGCAKRPGGKGGESVNCNTTVRTLCDAHIDVLQNENTDRTNGRNVFVVEVTERSRRLASRGLLTSSPSLANDWSTANLKSKLEGHRVRFSGFLFFDTDHFDQAFITDPDDNIGRSNFRQTAWEVHPVMGIEILD